MFRSDLSKHNENLLGVIGANVILSTIAGYLTRHFIKEFIPIFIARKHYGIDQCKPKEPKIPVPEPMGIIAAGVYLISMFLFIPVLFFLWIQTEAEFPSLRLNMYLAAILTITTAIFLGFVDDMLDLRWRHKLLFPTLSSLPLLMIYYICGNSTSMLLPKYFQSFIGTTYIDIGPLFYIYMGMVGIFCTNAINIIAGINGVEVGQGIVIGSSVAIFNIIQIYRLDTVDDWFHSFSLCILLPFLATSFALYSMNVYPAKVFVGDTYCYWAGMLLGVVGILGHFSKTLLLFCIPQVFNFLYSVPQLFHFVPCPRHRLPKFDEKGDQRLHMSMAEFEPSKLSPLGKLIVTIFRLFGLLHYREFEKDDSKWAEVNNMTILNLILKFTGPLHEYRLNQIFLGIQIFCSICAFICRFYFAYLLYDVVS
jgi:UDP-N-acetylglucosamine--dolichyl-phosphate N-acetylglucosaminephosphotransferase